MCWDQAAAGLQPVSCGLQTVGCGFSPVQLLASTRNAVEERWQGEHDLVAAARRQPVGRRHDKQLGHSGAHICASGFQGAIHRADAQGKHVAVILCLRQMALRLSKFLVGNL